MLAFASGALSIAQLGVVVGIASAMLGGFYTMRQFAGERRAGRIAEEDFYQRVYQGLNDALNKEVERQRREIADRDARIDRLQADIERLENRGKRVRRQT